MHPVGPPYLGYRPLGPKVVGLEIDGLPWSVQDGSIGTIEILPWADISHGESSTARSGWALAGCQ